VKKSGRDDEAMWVAIPMCMEAMVGISLYSYLYLKPAKTLSFLLSLMFSLQQNWRTRGENRFCLGAEVVGDGWGRQPKQCTHISKCKTDKIK
jgi:hypothetical protein